MCLSIAFVIRIAGPLVRTRRCGMTSLFVTVSQPPRRRVIEWLALKAPPLTDQEWQPRISWRIRTEACPGVVEAADAAPARPRVRASARRMGMRLKNIECSLIRFLGVSALTSATTSAVRRVSSAGFPQLGALQRAAVGPGLQTHARVDRDAAGGRCDDRVEIELGKLGDVDREPGQPVDERDERSRLGRRGTAVTADEPACLAALYELVGVEIGQRRDAEVGATDQLCEDAPGTEGDERA